MQIAQVLSRLLAGRRRPAAPRHGQEDPVRDGCPARELRRGRREERRQEGQGLVDLRPGRQVRGLRLQQEPRRRLCAGLLPDGLSQGQPSGRVLRRDHDPRYGQRRQAERLSGATSRRSASRCCRPTSHKSTGRVHGRDRRPKARRRSATRWPPSRASAATPWTGWSRSARPTARSRTCSTSPSGSTSRVLNKRLVESLVKAGAFDTLNKNRAQTFGADRGAAAPFAGDARIAGQQPEQPVRRRHRAAPAAASQGAGLGADGAAAERVRARSASISPRIRWPPTSAA